MMGIVDWMDRHMVMTMLLGGWIMSLVTFVTVWAFVKTPDIPAGTAAVIGTVWAGPGLVIGLWKWRGDRLGDRAPNKG